MLFPERSGTKGKELPLPSYTDIECVGALHCMLSEEEPEPPTTGPMNRFKLNI